MSDYTPTTEQVRAIYADESGWTPLFYKPGTWGEQFDRWLVSVKAEAWDEGVIFQQTENGIPFAHVADELHANPYRQAVTE